MVYHRREGHESRELVIGLQVSDLKEQIGPQSLQKEQQGQEEGGVDEDRLPPSAFHLKWRLLHLTRSALNFGTHREQSIEHLADLAYATSAFAVTWKDPHVAAAMIMEAAATSRARS